MNGVTAILEGRKLDIPASVVDLDSFHRWVEREQFPRTWRICYIQGRVWLDTSMEEMNHNQIKLAFSMSVAQLVLLASLGRYFADGMRLGNRRARLSTEPDGVFVSRESLRSRRVRLIEGKGQSPIRLQGTPDMALEVVSPSSVDKDTIALRQKYWDAGIPEYWLVNPLGDRLEFDILRHGAKGYVATRKEDGWMKSSVLGKSFRLVQRVGDDGFPLYIVEVR
jgi:Uma2 family endonuclease